MRAAAVFTTWLVAFIGATGSAAAASSPGCTAVNQNGPVEVGISTSMAVFFNLGQAASYWNVGDSIGFAGSPKTQVNNSSSDIQDTRDGNTVFASDGAATYVIQPGETGDTFEMGLSTIDSVITFDLACTPAGPGPIVTAISPVRGGPAGGTSVAITGQNFTGATAVAFGSTAAAAFTVSSATQITATSPAGIGTVDVTVTTPSGTSPTSSADQFIYATTNTHDFNGDGKSDIAWRDTSGNLAAWLMNGGAVLQSAGLGAVPSSFSIIGQHDFNGDGKADVLWRDSSGNVSMWLMNGAAVGSAAAVGNLTSNWTLSGTGDLNGDGKGDLLWRDSNTGTVAVWFMNGATIASTASFGALPSTWTIVGDANGEILWRDSSGDIALWGVQGGQVTSSSGLGTVTGNFVVQGVGDFNGDGKLDILWRDTNSGALSIWFTNGTQVTSGASVGTLPSNWSVAQVGDYNGDGKSDILLLDNAGDLAVWEMNGAAVSSSLPISNVGPTWTVQNLNAH